MVHDIERTLSWNYDDIFTRAADLEALDGALVIEYYALGGRRLLDYLEAGSLTHIELPMPCVDGFYVFFHEEVLYKFKGFAAQGQNTSVLCYKNNTVIVVEQGRLYYTVRLEFVCLKEFIL